MFPKHRRLNLKKDFKWVALGKKIETKFVKIFIRFGDNIFPKIGIALSSKTFKKATARNRAKRVISQALEILYNKLPNNANIIALPKPGVLEVKSADVVLALEEALISSGVI